MVVLGSINHDITVVVDRLPEPGETVIGSEQHSGPGGKGANQAVAAARLGASVAMIGRVGGDREGRSLVEVLEGEGVDVSAVTVDEAAASGLAIVTVDSDGENSIVVVPGANGLIDPGQVELHRDLIESASVVLTQLEIPVEAVATAASMADGIFLLNPAPAGDLPADLLTRVDVLIPNRGELARLAGAKEPRSSEEVAELALRLEGPESVVITLGAGGVLLVEKGEPTHVPAPEVEVVDSTGAGDAFCGALAAALARGSSLAEATRIGVAAGALATTSTGAQSALPTLSELEEFL